MTPPFLPQNLPVDALDANIFVETLGAANRALSRYDGMVRGLINPDILLSPFMTQEAVLSSKIEGTQATIDEVYEQGAGVSFSDRKNEDINEIKNYRSAMRFASHSLHERPLSLGLVREIHRILMEGVRGNSKSPGLFREIQNWIGLQGCPMEQATYLPPDPIHVVSLMENWLDYIVHKTQVDPLVQTAVMHVQFEMIHPFLDGNGRIGRLMIPLFLYARGILHRPMFYMSSYLEANREEYYTRLKAVHEKGEWNQWISFFLQGIQVQAEENMRRAIAINELYESLRSDFRSATHSTYSQLLLDCIFETPIFTKPQIISLMKEQESSCQDVTVRNLLNQIVGAGLVSLMSEGSGRKPAVFDLKKLINIASGR
ncbi:MAG: Fic family protein [Akkermansia sp.]